MGDVENIDERKKPNTHIAMNWKRIHNNKKSLSNQPFQLK